MLVASGEEPETSDVRDHLAKCDACRQLYADLGRVESLSVPEIEPPEDVHRRILASARSEAFERKLRRKTGLAKLGWVFGAVPRLAWAALFLAVVSIGVWQYDRPSEESTSSLTGEELDYSLAAVEMQLNALESEIEMSLMDIG